MTGMVPVSELNVMLISAICLFLSIATKMQPCSSVKDRDRPVLTPLVSGLPTLGECIWAHHKSFRKPHLGFLPQGNKMLSSSFLVQQCSQDLTRLWGPRLLGAPGNSRVPQYGHSYVPLPCLLWDVWKVLQKAERWTRWDPVVSFKFYIFTFLWLPLRVFPYKNSGGQPGLSALQPFRCTNKTFPFLTFDILHVCKILPLYSSFYFRSVFWLSLALFDRFFFC